MNTLEFDAFFAELGRLFHVKSMADKRHVKTMIQLHDIQNLLHGWHLIFFEFVTLPTRKNTVTRLAKTLAVSKEVIDGVTIISRIAMRPKEHVATTVGTTATLDGVEDGNVHLTRLTPMEDEVIEVHEWFAFGFV